MVNGVAFHVTILVALPAGYDLISVTVKESGTTATVATFAAK